MRMSKREYQLKMAEIRRENVQKQYKQSLREEKRKYDTKRIETSKLLAIYLFVLFNAVMIYAMAAMWVLHDLTYLGVLITDIAAQVLIYAIYCLKAYCAKKQSENVKLRRERYAGISGEENNGSLNEILSAGADSIEPVPFTNGATVNVYDYGADNGSVGYGLAQWTYHTRKKALLAFAQSKKKSVGDLGMQLEFLYKELSESYKGVFADLKSAKTILAASNSVLMKFERPANQSAAVQNKRAAYGQKFYDKYAGKTPVVPEQKPSAVPYRVRVTADVLNIRKGAGTGYAVAGQIKGGGVYTIVEEKDGTGAKSWGKLKSGAGWISLDYTSRV